MFTEIEGSPQLAQFDWTQCRHEVKVRWGMAGEKQRVRCKKCGRTWVENRVRRVALDFVKLIGPCFRDDTCISEAARIASTDRATVRRYYRRFHEFKNGSVVCK